MNCKRAGILAVAVAVFVMPNIASVAAESANFHHIHLNVTDPAKTIEFYEKFFGGVSTKYRGGADAVFTDRSFLFLNKVDTAPAWEMTTGLYHIGWGGVDGPSDFEWRDREGVQWETPLNALGTNHYMYAFGPDKEVVEVWTGFHHHRFGHVHLFADDVNASKNWYRDHLGLTASADTPKPPKAPADLDLESGPPMQVFRYLWSGSVRTDNDVTINVFAKPSLDTINWWSGEPLGDLIATDGRVIDHIAFSYPDIDPVFKRMKDAGVEIVRPIANDEKYGVKSFFVRGPDKVLIEIVEAEAVLGGTTE